MDLTEFTVYSNAGDTKTQTHTWCLRRVDNAQNQRVPVSLFAH
jgi:hypothetical protein